LRAELAAEGNVPREPVAHTGHEVPIEVAVRDGPIVPIWRAGDADVVPEPQTAVEPKRRGEVEGPDTVERGRDVGDAPSVIGDTVGGVGEADAGSRLKESLMVGMNPVGRMKIS
jgi:hypothetical protein